MSGRKTTIHDLMSNSEIENLGLYLVINDHLIVNYLCDNFNDLLEKLDPKNNENCGIAMFFNNENLKRNLVIIITYLNFKSNIDNGLIAMVISDIHINKSGVKIAKDLIKNSFIIDKRFKRIINKDIDKKKTESINFNARI